MVTQAMFNLLTITKTKCNSPKDWKGKKKVGIYFKLQRS